MKKKVSILIPCYNEEKSLSFLFHEISKLINKENQYEWEIILVNDGSKDNTLKILKEQSRKDKRFFFIDLSRNFGKENAMLAGFDNVTGDCMIIMDADLQDPPSLIPELLRKWEEGYEDVYAKRKNRGKESCIRRFFSLTFYKILERSTRFEVLQNVGDFRLLDRKCIDALIRVRESERYTKGIFCWIGFKKKEVVFDRGDRIAGTSNWNFISLFNLAIEGITSFTTTPLRFSAILGFLIAFCAFILMLYYFFKTLIWGDPIQGFTTLVILILFLGGIQLVAIGILGEYLSRIFHETKKRPVYLIRESNIGEKVND